MLATLGIGLATGRMWADSPASAPSAVIAADGIDHLRDAIKAAYNSGDVDAMLRYIHPEAVIVFQDGQILKGRDDLRKYYDRMLKAPDRIVASYNASSRTAETAVAR